MADAAPRRRITREQAEVFRRRWQMVNDAEKEELRTTPVEVKLRQLAALMASAKALGWDTVPETGEVLGPDLWRRLRQAYGV